MCTFLRLQHTRTCRRAHVCTVHTRLQHPQVLPAVVPAGTWPGRRAVGTGHPCVDAQSLPFHSDVALTQNRLIQHHGIELNGLTYASKPCLRWRKTGRPLNTNATPFPKIAWRCAGEGHGEFIVFWCEIRSLPLGQTCG